jgi:predicted RNA-binding Zn ribbon-like protein
MLLTVEVAKVRSQVGIDHDSVIALEDLVWLVNSDDPSTGEEHLPTPAALADWVSDRRVSGSLTGTAAELRSMHRLRARLRAVFDVAADGNEAGVVDAINTLIADCDATPRLVRHDHLPLHLHFTPNDAPLDQRLGAEIAVAIAIVVRDLGYQRLRRCAAPGCGRALVDLTKNRSRRYCDAQCGNRVHVAAYRNRR